MTELRQKTPRVRNEKYLAYLRTLNCACCGRAGASDAAHIRAANLELGKRECGKQEKPDDRWAVALHRTCHFRQHSMRELEFWKQVGKDPFALAQSYYARHVAESGDIEVKKPRIRKIRNRPAPELRKKIQNRGFK